MCRRHLGSLPSPGIGNCVAMTRPNDCVTSTPIPQKIRGLDPRFWRRFKVLNPGIRLFGLLIAVASCRISLGGGTSNPGRFMRNPLRLQGICFRRC
jgi:hypothetical protein